MPDDRDSEFFILDASGQLVEVDFLSWGIWFSETDRTVVETLFPVGNQKVRVSTCFMGLAPNRGDRSRRLWETMVFRGDKSTDGQRYRSREEAIEGHFRLVGQHMRGDRDE